MNINCKWAIMYYIYYMETKLGHILDWALEILQFNIFLPGNPTGICTYIMYYLYHHVFTLQPGQIHKFSGKHNNPFHDLSLHYNAVLFSSLALNCDCFTLSI